MKYNCSYANCLACDQNNTCLKCVYGFILSNGSCKSTNCTLFQCSECKPFSVYCDRCSAGYSLNIWTNKCEKLPKMMDNNCFSHETYGNSYQCIDCHVGYTLSPCKMKCVK